MNTKEIIQETRLVPRASVLSWMASMSAAAGEMHAAESYLLELLALCAFGDRPQVEGQNQA